MTNNELTNYPLQAIADGETEILDKELTLDLLQDVNGGFKYRVTKKLFDSDAFLDQQSNGPIIMGPSEEELDLDNIRFKEQLFNRLVHSNRMRGLEIYNGF